jgi:hypothetical protein
MATLQFPDITPPLTPEDQPENVGMASDAENGTVISRAKFTRSRLTFYLNWGEKNPLTTAERELLRDFYQNQAKGSSEKFEWTCNAPFSPHFGKTYIVRFGGDSPRFRIIAPGYWATEITLKEA